MGKTFLDLHVFHGGSINEATLWVVSEQGWMRVDFTLPPNIFTTAAATEAAMLADRYAQSYENVKGDTWLDSRVYIHHAGWRHGRRGYSYRVDESSDLARDINGVDLLRPRA